MKIINDDSRVVNKLEASLTDNTRVIIYDRYMFIVQATGFTLDSSLFYIQRKIGYCKICVSAPILVYILTYVYKSNHV